MPLHPCTDACRHEELDATIVRLLPDKTEAQLYNRKCATIQQRQFEVCFFAKVKATPHGTWRKGMAKAIYKDGKVFRLRRGKLVEIPKQWVGKIPTEQTIRKRRSKRTKQQRAEQARPAKSGYFNDDYWKAKHGKARHAL